MDSDLEIDSDPDICHTNYYTTEEFNKKFNMHNKNSSLSPNRNDSIEASNHNSDDHFSMLHLNARSINNKFDYIDLLLLSSIYHIQMSIIEYQKLG